MKFTFRLIAVLLLSAPMGFTAGAQSAPAPANADANHIELALETPEGYKPVSLAQMEVYLHSLREDFGSTNDPMHGHSPDVISWTLVQEPYRDGSIFGLLARYQDGSTSVSWVSQNSAKQWVLDPEGRTTFCGLEKTTGQIAEKTPEGCCEAAMHGPLDGFCRSTSDCYECLKSSTISGTIYEHKAFR